MKKSAALLAGLALTAIPVGLATPAQAAPACSVGTVCLYDDGVKVATLTGSTGRDITFDRVVNNTRRSVAVTWYGSFSNSFGYPSMGGGTTTVAAGSELTWGSHIGGLYADVVRFR